MWMASHVCCNSSLHWRRRNRKSVFYSDVLRREARLAAIKGVIRVGRRGSRGGRSSDTQRAVHRRLITPVQCTVLWRSGRYVINVAASFSARRQHAVLCQWVVSEVFVAGASLKPLAGPGCRRTGFVPSKSLVCIMKTVLPANGYTDRGWLPTAVRFDYLRAHK